MAPRAKPKAVAKPKPGSRSKPAKKATAAAPAQIVLRPSDLDEHAARAWEAMIVELGDLTLFDELALEAAARTWGRWKALEIRITNVAGGDVLVGEISKDRNKVSAMRLAANSAFKEFRDICATYGFRPPTTEAPITGLDMFGHPIAFGHGQKGRPPKEPSIAQHNRVCILLAVGWSIERIAKAVEMTPPTLRKYFGDQIGARFEMRDRMDARLLELAMASANAGNMAALKEVERLVAKQDALLSERKLEAPEDEPEVEAPPPEVIGKKEAQSRAALVGEAALDAEIAAEVAKAEAEAKAKAKPARKPRRKKKLH